MEWIKIPVADIVSGKFTNLQIAALVKYQALFASLEEEPTERQLLKNFTPTERAFLVDYMSTIGMQVVDELSKIQKKRTINKLSYCKKTNNSKIQTSESNLKSGIDKIREDKIREDKKRVEKKNASRTPSKLRFDDVADWRSLFEYWEQNKKGGRYANAESRQRMLARLKELTSEDFDYAKEAIVYAVDNKYQGFSDGSKLYYKKPPNRNRESWDDYWLEMEEKLAKKQGDVA